MKNKNIEELRKFVVESFGASQRQCIDSRPSKLGYAHSFFWDLALGELCVRTFGDDITVASYESLDDFQIGYSWNPKYAKAIDGWPQGLLVVATQSSSAFALNEKTGQIVFMSMVGRCWIETFAFFDLFEMIQCFGCINMVARKAKSDFVCEGRVGKNYVQEAHSLMMKRRLSEDRADAALKILDWQ